MNSPAALIASLFTIGCSTKQPMPSFVKSYSLTDEARIQLVGQYVSSQTPNVELRICEANGTKQKVLYIEHNQMGNLQQMVVKMDSIKYDHTGHRSISLTGHRIKNPKNFEGLCTTGTEGIIEDEDLITNTCTGKLRWHGYGFDGFWGKACGPFSDELIRVNTNVLTVFSNDWRDMPDQATTSTF